MRLFGVVTKTIKNSKCLCTNQTSLGNVFMLQGRFATMPLIKCLANEKNGNKQLIKCFYSNKASSEDNTMPIALINPSSGNDSEFSKLLVVVPLDSHSDDSMDLEKLIKSLTMLKKYMLQNPTMEGSSFYENFSVKSLFQDNLQGFSSNRALTFNNIEETCSVAEAAVPEPQSSEIGYQAKEDPNTYARKDHCKKVEKKPECNYDPNDPCSPKREEPCKKEKKVEKRHPCQEQNQRRNDSGRPKKKALSFSNLQDIHSEVATMFESQNCEIIIHDLNTILAMSDKKGGDNCKKEDPCKKKEKKEDPCKKKEKKEDPCKKKEDPCKKKEEKKKEDPCKKKEDPCKKKEKKEDPCKKDKKKEDPCKKKEEKKKEDPCKKKEDPCKKKEKKEDPCKKDKKKEDPCKKKEEKKKEDPCKKKEKKEDPCKKDKKKEDPCKKKEEKKKEDPCKKKEDPCKKKEKKEDPCKKDKKKEDPCKKKEKKEDPCKKDKKKEDPCKKKEEKKKEDPCKKKEDPCKKKEKKEDPCKKKCSNETNTNMSAMSLPSKDLHVTPLTLTSVRRFSTLMPPSYIWSYSISPMNLSWLLPKLKGIDILLRSHREDLRKTSSLQLNNREN